MSGSRIFTGGKWKQNKTEISDDKMIANSPGNAIIFLLFRKSGRDALYNIQQPHVGDQMRAQNFIAQAILPVGNVAFSHRTCIKQHESIKSRPILPKADKLLYRLKKPLEIE